MKIQLSPILLTILSTSMLGAAELSVSNLNDSGGGSLRNIMAIANQNGEADTITFNESLRGQTLILTSQEIVITSEVSIVGFPDALTLSGNQERSIFTVTEDAVVTISDLNFIDGVAQRGAGINNSGTLIVSNCLFRNHVGSVGCGIENNGSIEVTDCRFEDNVASDDGAGFNNCINGSGFIDRCSFSGNTNTNNGAGLSNFGAFTVTNSVFFDNSAVNEDDDGTGPNPTRNGGAIFNNGELTLVNSALFDNVSGVSGGAIYNRGGLVLINCTLSGNTSGRGAAISSRSGVQLIQTTIADNVSTAGGGGLFFQDFGNLLLTNSIVANNTEPQIELAPNLVNNTGGFFLFPEGLNIFSDDSILEVPNFRNSFAFLTNTDPLLGALADNGGPVPTQALSANSPAIDAGSNFALSSTSPVTLEVDSRGAPRIFDFSTSPAGATVDVGAFEANPSFVGGEETPELTNLALGQPTVQSSTGFQGVSSRAVDGDTNGRYGAASVTHTNRNESQPWWQVDLGQESDIATIEIWNRTDGSLGNRLRDFTLFVSDEDTSELSFDELRSDPSVFMFAFDGIPGESSLLSINFTGRFVRIQLPGSGNPLSLAEVIVNGSVASSNSAPSVPTVPEPTIPVVITNLALGQTTIQSSTGFGGVSSRAVDGDTNGAYRDDSVSHTSGGNEAQPWWQVDLGQISDISTIEVWNRTDGSLGARLSDFTLFVSNEDTAERSFESLLSDGGVSMFSFDGVPEETTTIPFAVAGRYVRIQLPGSGDALSLAEVIVNGSVSTTQPTTPEPTTPEPTTPEPTTPEPTTPEPTSPEPTTDVEASTFDGLVPQLPARIQVENYNLGGQGVGYFDLDPENRGGIFRNDAVDIEDSNDTDGTPSIGWAFDSEWTQYLIEVPAGNYRVNVRAASLFENPGSLLISLGGEEITTVDVESTGGWFDWETFSSAQISLPAGRQILRLTFQGDDFNLNWVEFVPAN